MTSKELREKRAKVHNQMAEVTRKLKAGSILSDAENKEFDVWDKEFEELTRQITQVEKVEEREANLAMENGKSLNGSIDTDDKPESKGNLWFRSDGSSINVIDSKNKLSRKEENNQVSFGQVVRSYLKGPRNEAEARAQSEGTNSAGGYTVPESLSRNIIDKLRARSTVSRAGMQTVTLDSDSNVMAKLTGDPTVSWRGENSTISDSDLTFSSVTWTPRSLAGIVKASSELIQDSLNIEQAIEMAFTQTMSSELDRAALLGTGTAPEPEGIVSYASVNSHDMGASAGAALTNYDPFIEAIKLLYDSNANDPTAAIMAPRTWSEINTLKDANNNYLSKPGAIANLPMYQTSKIPITDTHGTATDASKIVIGDFTQLVMGVRLGITIKALDQRYADANQIGFLAVLRADFQPLHEKSFCLIEGIIP
jgi:HK97 family phage major capsid protein